MHSLTHFSGFKRVIELMKQGKVEQALVLQKGLQDEFMDLFDENETLKKQLSEVADVLDLSQCISFDGHKYWLEDEGHREGPYCQVCYDRDSTLVRLNEHDRHWECKGCNNLYMKPQPTAVEPTVAKELPKPQIKEPIPLFAK